MRKIITKAIALLIAFSTVTLAQEKGSFTDPRDKKKYKTVKIGEQVWMAENLNYADKDSKCYQDKPANCTQYGRLYNWETAMKACPKGWHLPRKREWDELLFFADSTYKTDYSNNKAGKHLKAKSGWKSGAYTDINGTDTYGFSALPGGIYYGLLSYRDVGEKGNWWGGTVSASVSFDVRRQKDGVITTDLYSYAKIDERIGATGYEPENSAALRSIRCIQGGEETVAKIDAEDKAEMEAKVAKEKAEAEAKEAKQKAAKEKAEAETKAKAEAEAKAKTEALAEAAAPLKDPRDGKTYKKIIYNSIIWMAENLNYDVKGSKCYDNKPDNCKKYGRLYDYETAKKACPAGWRLPTREEAGVFQSGVALKSESGWDDYKGLSDPQAKSGGGTNEIGFTALPGGYYGPNMLGKNVNFYDIGKGARWWSDATNIAYTFGVSNSNKDISTFSPDDKNTFYSVRCVNNTRSIIPRYP
jgi:uncharacterized protein (TIGR02145 family)